MKYEMSEKLQPCIILNYRCYMCQYRGYGTDQEELVILSQHKGDRQPKHIWDCNWPVIKS